MYNQWRIQDFRRGGERRTMYQPRRHLSQIYAQNEIFAFIPEKRVPEIFPAAPQPFLESATAYNTKV